MALILAGCGGTDKRSITDPTPPPPPSGYAGVAVTGTALSGASPITGASVQLFAAGTTGNGSAPTSLGSPVTTSASGAFTVPAGYLCPQPSSQLYLIARGGAVAPAPANPAIALAVPLGRCDAIAASTSFTLNEVTTAATTWPLAQFLSTSGNLGASSTNTTGLANAVSVALSLSENTTGASPGSTYPSNGSPPATRVNALANLLHACTASAAACPQLFSLTTPPGLSAPSDTLAAGLNLVHNPGANVSALFTLAQTSTAFTPTLPSTPADWTLPLTFTGAGMNQPGPLAVDSQGNIWVASYFGVASKFSPTGAPAFASGISGSGLSESYGLAIDTSDNVWITDEDSPSVNSNNGAVTVLNSGGQPLSGPAGFSSGGLNYPVALAIDPNRTTWVVDYGNSHLTQLSSSGQPLSGPSGYFSNLFAFPVAIALDAAHFAWVANSSGNDVIKVSPDGAQFTAINCCNTAAGLALDSAGNVWVANYLGDSISEIANTGAVLSTGYIGGGLLHPQGIAVDSAGTVWIANLRGNSITELAGQASPHPGQPLSPPAGWAPTPASLQAFAIAIDAGGNLWVSNFAANSITELVGLASPVKTPLSALPQAP